MDAPLPGTLLLDDVVAAGGKEQNLAQLRCNQRFLSCYDPINIQFTSGTTGNPKGATLSHHNIVNNSNLIGQRLKMPTKVRLGWTLVRFTQAVVGEQLGKE